MQILTIRKGFEVFECKFEQFERIQSIQMQIWTIPKEFKAFECKFEPFESDSNHSNVNSNHLNQIRTIRIQTKMKGIQSFRIPIQSIRVQILTIWKVFEAFKRNSKQSKEIQSNRKEFKCKF